MLSDLHWKGQDQIENYQLTFSPCQTHQWKRSVSLLELELQRRNCREDKPLNSSVVYQSSSAFNRGVLPDNVLVTGTLFLSWLFLLLFFIWSKCLLLSVLYIHIFNLKCSICQNCYLCPTSFFYYFEVMSWSVADIFGEGLSSRCICIGSHISLIHIKKNNINLYIYLQYILALNN